MNRRGLLLEVALFVGAGLCFALTLDWPQASEGLFTPAPRAAGVVRVMTWNVGSPGGRHGSALRDEFLSSVADTIRENEPDLCILQELHDEEQATRLVRALGEPWKFEISKSGSRRVAAFHKTSGIGYHGGVDAPTRSLTLGLLVAEDQWIVACGLHADAWSSRERNAQIGGATRSLLTAKLSGPRLLLGDFNLDVDQRGDLFSDNAHLDLETYNFVAENWVDVGQGTGPTAEPDRRLDYIFVRPKQFEILRVGPLLRRRVGDMDHDPLIADLRLL